LIFPLFVNRCRHRGNVKRNSSHFARGILLSWLCIIAAYGGPLDDWTTRDSGVSADLYGIAHGNNTFVVVGDRGTILTSSDGISWVPRASGLPTNEILVDVTFGAGTFVA